MTIKFQFNLIPVVINLKKYFIKPWSYREQTVFTMQYEASLTCFKLGTFSERAYHWHSWKYCEFRYVRGFKLVKYTITFKSSLCWNSSIVYFLSLCDKFVMQRYNFFNTNSLYNILLTQLIQNNLNKYNIWFIKQIILE